MKARGTRENAPRLFQVKNQSLRIQYEFTDAVAVIQAADERSRVGREALVTRLADVGIHVRAGEKRPIVQGNRLAPGPDRSDAIEPREEAGTASLERRDRVGLELREGSGSCLDWREVPAAHEPHQGIAVKEQVRNGARVDACVLRGGGAKLLEERRQGTRAVRGGDLPGVGDGRRGRLTRFLLCGGDGPFGTPMPLRPGRDARSASDAGLG